MSVINFIRRVLSFFRTQRVVDVRVASMATNNLLKGRCALITGGTSGIGFSIAEAFLNAGAAVVITGRSQDRIDAAIAKLPKGKLAGMYWIILRSIRLITNFLKCWK